ncbi:MAG: FAD-dependent oxidoreductase, partial [Cyanobacteria bacterium J06638_22]
PRVGAEIFADWAAALPNLQWIAGQVPLAAKMQGDRLTAVEFADYHVTADIILDGTELGDLLALADVPHCWGWELQSDLGEASAPVVLEDWMRRYSVQAPTWVVVMQDFGDRRAPTIPSPDRPRSDDAFVGAWEGYGSDMFLNYGRLPGDRFMINWPQKGNDYGENINRLIASEAERRAFFQDARDYSQQFAHFIQTELGDRYGLAVDTFPQEPQSMGGGAFALHPYFRESRRLVGLKTVCEADLLPLPEASVAPLPRLPDGTVEAIALGNYPNDHHYPGHRLPLQSRSLYWGGRWTGVPFAVPYRCLVPQTVDGLLVCEKNISVSHIANGATRLQPTVMGIGQAAGMAAALCVEQRCQPRSLPVRFVQQALLTDAIAPAAIIPSLSNQLGMATWRSWQERILNDPECYLTEQPEWLDNTSAALAYQRSHLSTYSGTVYREVDRATQLETYWLHRDGSEAEENREIKLVALDSAMNEQLKGIESGQRKKIQGYLNAYGKWLRVENFWEAG